MTGKETIICIDCGKEVIKRSVNHVRCMDCGYKFVQEKIQQLYKLDMRNEQILKSMKEDEKEI